MLARAYTGHDTQASRANPASDEASRANGRKRFFREYLQEIGFALTEVSGNLREFTAECDLGILYSSSLVHNHLPILGA